MSEKLIKIDKDTGVTFTINGSTKPGKITKVNENNTFDIIGEDKTVYNDYSCVVTGGSVTCNKPDNKTEQPITPNNTDNKTEQPITPNNTDNQTPNVNNQANIHEVYNEIKHRMRGVILDQLNDNNIELNDFHSMVKEKFITQNKELSNELLSGCNTQLTLFYDRSDTYGFFSNIELGLFDEFKDTLTERGFFKSLNVAKNVASNNTMERLKKYFYLLHSVNVDGLTTLQYACFYNRLDIVILILSYLVAGEANYVKKYINYYNTTGANENKKGRAITLVGKSDGKGIKSGVAKTANFFKRTIKNVASFNGAAVFGDLGKNILKAASTGVISSKEAIEGLLTLFGSKPQTESNIGDDNAAINQGYNDNIFLNVNKDLSKIMTTAESAPISSATGTAPSPTTSAPAIPETEPSKMAIAPATPGIEQKRTTDYIIEEYNKSMQNKSKDYIGTAVMCINPVKIQEIDIKPFKKYIIKTKLENDGSSTYKIIIDPEKPITEDEINENFKYKLDTTHYIKFFYTNADIDFKDKIINIKYKGNGDNTFVKNTLYRVKYNNNEYSIYKNSNDAVLQDKDRITVIKDENEINTNFELALKHPPIVKIYNDLNNIKTTSEKVKEFGSNALRATKNFFSRFSRSKEATTGGKYKSRRYRNLKQRFTRRKAWK